MAFTTTGLTELGPYGVPTSIRLELFTDGIPLRSIIAVGLISQFCNVTGRLAVLDIDNNVISIMDEETGEIILTVESDAYPTLESEKDGYINLVDEVRSS